MKDGWPARNGTTTTSRWPRPSRRKLGQPQGGLASGDRPCCKGRSRLEDNYGGGSDDIGDVSWNVPTVTLNYPSNIPGMPGHNWANAVAMATPIAHKGATAGAKVIAMTALDFLCAPGAGPAGVGLLPQHCRRKIRNTSRCSVRPISR